MYCVMQSMTRTSQQVRRGVLELCIEILHLIRYKRGICNRFVMGIVLECRQEKYGFRTFGVRMLMQGGIIDGR